MFFYSFDENKLDRQNTTGNLFDLFKTTITDKELSKLEKFQYIVTSENDGRLDNVCSDIYDTNIYVEELMKINNIYNQYSIKAGNVILYISLTDMQNLYKPDDETKKSSKIDALNINNPKSTQIDSNRKNQLYTPIIKDNRTKQVYWNKDNKTIIINNKIN